jgi:hypothetical protein
LGQITDKGLGLLEVSGSVLEVGLVLSGSLLRDGPFAACEVELGFQGLTALPLHVQLGREPVALGAQGADTLVPFDKGDGLLSRLMLILPKALLGNPKASIGGRLERLAGGQLLSILKS